MKPLQIMDYNYFVFVTLFVSINAFMPTNYGTTETDYTHKLITERGVTIAAAKYIETFLQPLPSGPHNVSDNNDAMRTIQTFFGQDRHSLKLFTDGIKQIVDGNNNAQNQYGNDAKYTMNAEQILEGNLYLQNKRDSIITLSKSASPNWNFLLMAIGEYLMTLQMFYSNTNWIELKGQTVNTALGIREKTMIPVAPKDMATCTNCNYTVQALKDGSCDNNLVNNGEYLTSGYKGGQQISKPQGLWLSAAGKCSHGGSFDDTQSLTATGGINKETSDPSKSPHFRLHNQAGEAAIEATVYFFIGSDYGLLKMIGAGLFGDLLNLHAPCFNCMSKNLSLSFVIDDTGSMRPMINGVIKSCIDILNQAEDAGGAAYYNLVTFNDPVAVHIQRRTSDIHIMKTWLQSLTVGGGGDCPELAMQGLLKGIEMSAPDSCLFFFTDVDAKDTNYEAQVVQAAREKNMHLTLFLRGDCSGNILGDNSTDLKCQRRNDRENVGRRKRSLGGWGSFSNLMSSTSSSAVSVPAGAISKTIGDTINVNTGISFTYIANISMTLKGDILRFPIDNQIVYFTVEITGENYKRNIKLNRPDGTEEHFLYSNATIDFVGVTTILSIKKPVVGDWRLQNLGRNTWRVIVKGKGDISFESQLLEEKGGIPFPMPSSSPVAGSNITIGITVKDINDNSSLNKIILRSDDNNVIKEFDFEDTNKRVIYAKLAIPAKAFRITIEGKDSDGNVYQRTSKDMITPVTAGIIIFPVKGDLIEGLVKTVQVKVFNNGSIDDIFNLVATDTENYLQGPKQVAVSVAAKGSTVVDFKILGTRRLSVTTLSVLLKKGNRILQSRRIYLMVKQSIPPIINTKHQTPGCSEDYMNSVNCSFGTWFMETIVNCTHPCTDIYSASPVAFFSHDTLNKTGIITVNISGDCCSAESKLVAVDSLSNIVELPMDFTGGHRFKSIEATTSKKDPPNLTVVGKSHACEHVYMNSDNCTYGYWWAEVNIKFQAVGNAIYVSPNKSSIGNGSVAVIKHEELKLMKKDIRANVSGSCCLYNISLFAQDNKGQISTHQLDFSGGIKFQQIVSDVKSKYDLEDKSPTVPLTVVITVTIACSILVGILTAVAVNVYKKKCEVTFEDHVGFKNEMKQRTDRCSPMKFRH